MMRHQTKRKVIPKTIISRLWNEFLFARDFDYETSLTPDEVADAFKQLEKRKHKRRFITWADLSHNVHYDRTTDKSGTFTVQLDSPSFTLINTSGTISVNADSGMTVVKGKSHFNRRYYSIILLIFLPSFIFNSLQPDSFSHLFSIAFVIAFWVVMYQERNQLVQQLDDIIMIAKSDVSSTNLVDADNEIFDDALTLPENTLKQTQH